MSLLDAEKIKESRTDVCAIGACIFADDVEGLASFDEDDLETWRWRAFSAIQHLGAMVETLDLDAVRWFRDMARYYTLDDVAEHDPEAQGE